MKNLFFVAIALMVSFSLMAQTPLKLNLQTGKIYKVKTMNQQTVQASYNGQPFTSEVYTGISTSFKVLSVSKDVLLMEFKFDTIENKVNSPMAKRDINSAIPAKGKDYFTRILNKVSTSKLVAKISTSGKFIGFVNYKNFKDSVLMVMDSVPDSKREQVQKQAETYLGESILQSMIEPLFIYLPEKPVSTGDKWDKSYVSKSANASMILVNSYTLNGIENKVARISCTTQIESMPLDDPSVQMSMDLKGTSTSDLTADVTTGLIIKSSAKNHVEGNMNVKNQGNEMKMPTTVDAHLEIFKME